MAIRARDGQHAGAADAGHHRVPRPLEVRQRRLGQGVEQGLRAVAARGLRRLPPSTVTKLGQKPLAQL
jgi:hypothetical protein